MWYAVDINEGILAEYTTKREAVLMYSDVGIANKLASGVYVARSKGSLDVVTTYIINSEARSNAELHGFGWVFEDESIKRFEEIKVLLGLTK